MVKVPWDLRDLLSHRTAACIAYFVALGYLNCIGQVVAEYLSYQNTARGDLPDLAYVLLPYIPYPHVPTVTLVVLVGGVALRLALHESRFPSLLRRFLLMHATTFLFRGVCVAMTVLPNPDITCYSGLQNVPFPIAAALVALGLKNTCGDVFFSGHAATQVMVLLLVLNLTSEVTARQARLAVWYTAASILSILATHFHYTIDVVFGCLIAVAVFHFYSYATTIAADSGADEGSSGATTARAYVARLGKFWRRLEAPTGSEADVAALERADGGGLGGYTATSYRAAM